MNENFINTWVLNSQLERSPYTKTDIALRRKYDFKPFDKTRPLAQAIEKGWKKHSPADSLVISPKLELMGRLPVNERHPPYNGAKGYRLFLQESLDGKRPGLREDIPIHWDTLLETAVESGAMVDEDLVNVLTLYPDGKTLATGSIDRTIELWNKSDTDKPLYRLIGHTEGITAIDFSVDAKMLASGSSDKTVRLWDLTTGQAIHVFTGHTTEVGAVIFLEDKALAGIALAKGEALASGSADGTVFIWDMDKITASD